MIAAIQKALKILERLAKTPQTHTNLGVIAKDVGLNAATCARTLETLVDAGYVEQAGRRGGYTLGPRSYALSANGPYRQELIKEAEPPMRELAKRTGESVALGTLCRGDWIILLEIDGENLVQTRHQLLQGRDAVYHTGTGRILLAHLTDTEIAEITASRGLPGKEVWPEATTEDELFRELTRIRETDWVEIIKESCAVVACPVRTGDRVTAAVGCHPPLSRYDAATASMLKTELQHCAAAIETGLGATH